MDDEIDPRLLEEWEQRNGYNLPDYDGADA